MPLTSVLDELDAGDAIPDDLENEADEAAGEDVGAVAPAPTPATFSVDISDVDFVEPVPPGGSVNVPFTVSNPPGQGQGTQDIVAEIQGGSGLGTVYTEETAVEGLTLDEGEESDELEYEAQITEDMDGDDIVVRVSPNDLGFSDETPAIEIGDPIGDLPQ